MKISHTPVSTRLRIDVAAAVPAIEVADDGDAPRVRRPHREVHAGDAFVHERMRAEPVVEHRVRALADEPVVERPQHRAEGVRVVDRPRAVAHSRRAGGSACAAGSGPSKKPAGVALRERRERRAVLGDGLERLRAGNVRAQHDAAVDLVEAEHRERIGVAALDDRRDRVRAERALRGHRRSLGAGRRARIGPMRVRRAAT